MLEVSKIPTKHTVDSYVILGSGDVTVRAGGVTDLNLDLQQVSISFAATKQASSSMSKQYNLSG